MKAEGPDGDRIREEVSLIRAELDLSERKEYWADNIARWRHAQLESLEYKAAREVRHARGEFTDEEAEDDDGEDQDASFWQAMSDPCTWVDEKASSSVEYWD